MTYSVSNICIEEKCYIFKVDKLKTKHILGAFKLTFNITKTMEKMNKIFMGSKMWRTCPKILRGGPQRKILQENKTTEH